MAHFRCLALPIAAILLSAVVSAFYRPYQHVINAYPRPLPSRGLGVELQLQPNFITFLGQGAASVLVKAFTVIELPPVQLDTPVPAVGNIHLSLNQTRIFGIETDPRKVLVTVGNGLIAMNFTGFNISMSSKWRWTKGVLHSHGMVNVTAVDGSVMALCTLSADKLGRPLLGIRNVTLILGDLDVKISESRWTWLYSLIKNVFKDQLIGAVQSEVPKQIATTLPNELNKLFQSVPLEFALFRNARLDLSLAEPPIIDSSKGLIINRLGQFSVFRNARSMACPIPEDSAEDRIRKDTASHEGRMVEAVISERFLNCLLWSLHEEKFFNFTFALDSIIPIPTLAVNSTDPAASVTISLPTVPPTLALNEDGSLVVSVADGQIAFKLYLADRKPFEVHWKFSAAFSFLLRVVDGHQSSLLEFDLIQSQVQLRKDPSASLFTASDRLSLTNTHLHSAAMMALTRAVQEHLVPIPIKLPYPFDSIRIKDFGLHIERKRWILEADFAL